MKYVSLIICICNTLLIRYKDVCVVLYIAFTNQRRKSLDKYGTICLVSGVSSQKHKAVGP